MLWYSWVRIIETRSYLHTPPAYTRTAIPHPAHLHTNTPKYPTPPAYTRSRLYTNIFCTTLLTDHNGTGYPDPGTPLRLETNRFTTTAFLIFSHALRAKGHFEPFASLRGTS